MGATELLDAPKGKDIGLADRLDSQVDEVAYFCEEDGEVVGFCAICNYNIVNGERPNDNVGMISDIYVKEKYRNGNCAYELLQLSLQELIKAGKTAARVMVQEDNPNRFLHFAMADRILEKSQIERNDGAKTTNYDLLISDLSKLKQMTSRELGMKAARLRREFNKDEREK